MQNISEKGCPHNSKSDLGSRLTSVVIQICGHRGLRDPLAQGFSEFTPTQVHCLMWLGYASLTMGELAHSIGITEKTITGVVDRLERDGFLRRERSVDDRRVVRVCLTTLGEDANQRFKQHVHNKCAFLLELIDGGDREDFLRILEKVVKKLGCNELAAKT